VRDTCTDDDLVAEAAERQRAIEPTVG